MATRRENITFARLLVIALTFPSSEGKVQYPPAEFCNPETLEGCQGRQAEFAEMWRSKPLVLQLQMLDYLQNIVRYEDDVKWIDDQIIILENVIDYTSAMRGEL